LVILLISGATEFKLDEDFGTVVAVKSVAGERGSMITVLL
jgi:hypothetical protein